MTGRPDGVGPSSFDDRLGQIEGLYEEALLLPTQGPAVQVGAQTKSLFAAVLVRALKDYERQIHKRIRKVGAMDEPTLVGEVRAYFARDDDWGTFSFARVCEVLGLDRSRIREILGQPTRRTHRVVQGTRRHVGGR